MPNYTVKQGDCISSIAQRYGLFWEKVWNHSKNAKLKEKREDPNVLYLGDVVFVPDKEEKEESCATDQRHRFRKKGVREILTLKFVDHDDQPRAGETYILNIDGNLNKGQLDAEGSCSVPIPPDSRNGSVTLGDPDEGEIYDLDLGHMDPITETAGVQARLYNLGYFESEADGRESPELAQAVEAFQLAHGLSTEKGMDDTTRQKLVEVHGS